MTATLKDFNAIADQIRAAVNPDIKVDISTSAFNPYDGTPARTHYKISADIGGEEGYTLTNWYPLENTPDEVVAEALKMIGHLRPTPTAGETIEHKGREILVQFVQVNEQGNWHVLGRYIDGEDIDELADVLVTPFAWEEA